MTDELKPYPSYKDSGLPWFGKMPEHWGLVRVKHVLRERNVRGFPDEPLLAATQTKGVVRKEDYENRTVLAIKDLHLLKLVEVGDFVISLRSFQGGIEYARDRGIISPAYTILYTDKQSLHAYLAPLFKSRPFIDALRLFVTGIRQGQNIDYVGISRSSIPIPPQNEQTAVARFVADLDRRVNRFIRIKRRLIEVLAEIRQAETYGLLEKANGNDIRLNKVSEKREQKINRHPEKIYTPIGLYNRGRGLFHKETTKGKELGDSTFYWIYENDLVLSGQFAWEGAVALVGKEDSGCVASHRYHILCGKPEKVLTNYLLAFFKTKDGNLLLNYHSRGAAGRNRPLNISTLLKEKIPIPSISDQKRIAFLVDAEIRLVKEFAVMTSLVLEYRTRLIADVVTGKLDVRDLAPPSGSEDLEEMVDELEALEDTAGEMNEKAVAGEVEI